MRLATLTLLVATLAPIAHAQTTPVAQTCQANRNWVPVVELYTSEGCSSCPPAEAWLNSLASSAARHQVVPLAFHVDYWDNLGWRDPLAQASHSARQRQLARSEGGTVVYTPQVRLAGADFRAWRSAATVQSVLERSTPKPTGEVYLAIDRRDGMFMVSARATLPVATTAYVALYERMLTSKITRGENAGRTLGHDFVVRRLIGPFAPDPQGRLALRQNVTLETTWKRDDLGVALLQADAVSGAMRLGAAIQPGEPDRLSAPCL